MSAEIINFGSINIDHVYRVPHFVQPGETLASRSLQTVLGGKGANQSVAAARAGVKVAHVGRIGRADQWACDELVQAGVNTTAIQLADTASGHAIIQVNEAGENAIVLHGGANLECQIEQLEACLSEHPQARFLLLQNECNITPVAIERASQCGLAVVYNPAPMTDATPHYAFQNVDTLIVNQVEGAALSGERDSKKMLTKLRHDYPSCRIVLTLGAHGVVMFDGVLHEVPAYPADICDTTAAGDTFVGYFVAGMAANLPPAENLQRAAKAAALAVTKNGAIPSIPTLTEVNAK